MLIRQAILKLKETSAPEFTRIIEKDVIPLLRKHKGFRDIVTFVAPERLEAISYTFWNTNEEAEAYNSTGYPEVLNALSKVLDGTPQVESFSLSNSTFHKVDAVAV
jgi:hypothetical protein